MSLTIFLIFLGLIVWGIVSYICILFVAKKDSSITDKAKCFLISPFIIGILFYADIIYLLLSKYIEIIYPIIISFLLLSIPILFFLKKYYKYSRCNMLLALFFLAIPHIYMTKVLIENYIVNVSYRQYDIKSSAHININMNIFSIKNWLKDSHCLIRTDEHGLMLWSMYEKKFIEYEYNPNK